MTRRQKRASELKLAEKLARAGYVQSARVLLKRNQLRDHLVIVEARRAKEKK